MGRNAVTILAIALFFPACVVEGTDDDDGMGSETSSASSNEEGGEEEGGEEEGGEEEGGEESSEGGGEEGGDLNADCTDLCDRTPNVNDVEAACVPFELEQLGAYGFTSFDSCNTLQAAYEVGSATASMCVACYLDAGVEAAHCAAADVACF